MTRARVTAQQTARPPKGARLARGTVSTVSPLTVQIGGGVAVKGIPIPGATYTVGAAVLVLVQEPGIGPVYPLPGTTAIPAGPATGTAATTGRFAMQNNGARTITGNTWWDLAHDTYLAGQGGPMDRADWVGVNLPWAGRYSIFSRAAISGGDIPTSLALGIRAYRPSDGYVWTELGQWGIRSDMAMTLTDEITAAAGDVVRFCIYVPVTGRQLSYGADSVRTRCAVRYLGPA